MKLPILHLILTLCIFSLSSCSSTARLLTNTLGAAGGATIASHLSEGDPLVTAAGAGGGLLLGESLNYAQTRKAKASFTDGYDKGRSDAVKQQYWLLVEQQRKASGYEEEAGLSGFPPPGANGSLFAPASFPDPQMER